MSKSSLRKKISVITCLNMVVVFASSVFAIHGDGTSGGMFWVIGVGCASVVWFSFRAFSLAEQGKDTEAVRVISGALPYVFAILVAGAIAMRLLRSL